jgi:hypothetical protein
MVIVAYEGWKWVSGKVEEPQEFAQGTKQAEDSAQQEIEAELARLRDASEPVSTEDMESYYAIPAGAKDTTDLWTSASAALFTDQYDADAAGIDVVDRSRRAHKLPPPGKPWPELARAQRLLQKYRRPLDQLQQAARSGGAARYPTSFRDGVAMEMPHLQELMAAVRALRLQAQVRAHEGDSAAAIESVNTIFAAGKSLETYPNSVGQLICQACYSTGFSALKDMLPYVDFSDSQLAQLSQPLDRSAAEEGLYRAMLGERVMGLTGLDDAEEFLEFLTTEDAEVGMRITAEQAQNFAKVAPFTQQRDTWFYLRHMRGVVEASQQPWPERLQTADRLESEWKALGDKTRLGKEDFASLQEAAASDRIIIALLIAPPFQASFAADARFIALRDLTKTTLAIERYRNKHGQPPDALDQLKPTYLTTIPIDPFDGNPLRYIRDSSQYLVYSIGRDRKDDNDSGTLGGADADIVFVMPIVERPPPAAVTAVSPNSPTSPSPPQANSGQPPRRPSGFAKRPPRGPGFTPRPIGVATGQPFEDKAPAGGYLVGVRIIKGKNWGGVVHAIQPIYQVGDAQRDGKLLGRAKGEDRFEAVAKQGYAVGGIRAKRGAVIDAIQLIFYRIDGKKMNKQDKYESEWLGGDGGTGMNSVAFGGSFITGISGTFKDDVTSLRLIAGRP